MNIIDEIEELISKMDLTPAMYKNAMEKFDALKGCLKEKNPRIVFYPHGSLVLGTTVRPYREQKERNYDLDSVCLFNCSKDTPNSVPLPAIVSKHIVTLVSSVKHSFKASIILLIPFSIPNPT